MNGEGIWWAGEGDGGGSSEEFRDAGRSWSEDTIVRSFDFILME